MRELDIYHYFSSLGSHWIKRFNTLYFHKSYYIFYHLLGASGVFKGKNRRSIVKSPAEEIEATQTVNLCIKSRYKIVTHMQSYFYWQLRGPHCLFKIWSYTIEKYHIFWVSKFLEDLLRSSLFLQLIRWGFCVSDKLLRSLGQKKMIIIIFFSHCHW